MSQESSGDDPVVQALAGLVRSGAISPERAQAAYEGSLQPPATDSDGESPPASRQIGIESAVIAVGTGLFGAAIAVATRYSRQRSDLDWSNYAIGLLATLALFGVAAGTLVIVKDDVRKRNLAAWPGAVGAIGAALMIGIGLDDNPATGYVAGAVAALVSAVGYYLIQRAAFVISAILGLGAVFASLVDDIVDVGDLQSASTPLVVAAAVLVFAVVVTAAGWKLPDRDTAGVFVGALTVVAYATILAAVTFVLSIQRQFAGFGMSFDGERPAGVPDPKRFHDDIYLIVLFSAILIAGWAVCSVLSGHIGYRVLIVLMVASVVPLAVAGLAAEHPSWWGTGAAVLGAVALGAVGLRAIGVIGDFGTRPPRRPSGGPPINLDESR